MQFTRTIQNGPAMLHIQELSADNQFSMAIVTEALAHGDEPTEIMRWALTNIDNYVLSDNLDTLATLLEHGANPNLSINGESWLSHLLSELHPYDGNDHRVEAFKALVEDAKKHGFDARDKSIETLSFAAVHSSSYEFMNWLLDWLLQNGLDANATQDGMTLFMASLILKDRPFVLQISRDLLKHGADLRLGDVSGKNGFDFLQYTLEQALDSYVEECILELIGEVENKTGHVFTIPADLWFNADSESQHIIAALKGWNKDAINDDGDTALIISIRYGDSNMVKALLKNGANATAACKGGIAPVFYAFSLAQGGELGMADAALKIIKLLLKHGETLDRRSPNGVTPLMLGFRTNFLEFIHFILSEKLPWSIDQQSDAGDTTAHYALNAVIRMSNPIMINFLARIVLLKPNVDLQDANGTTVRTLAEKAGLTKILTNPEDFLIEVDFG